MSSNLYLNNVIYIKIFLLILISVILTFNSSNFVGLIMLVSRVEIVILSVAMVKRWFHVIIIILILEIIRVILFKLISLNCNLAINSNIIFFFITLIVIEARVGMGLVVNNSRSWDRGLRN